MCAMLFPESDTIAADHPELAQEIGAVDRYLAEMGYQPFRVGPTADLLGMDPGTLARLLSLYAACGIVEPLEVYLCPEDDNMLQADDAGLLWCDLCEGEYDAGACEQGVVYRVRSGVALPELSAAERGPAGRGATVQEPPIGTVRRLLLDAFTPETLRRFCQDRPTFRDVVHRFGPGHGLDDMVDEVVEYCWKQLLWKELLAEVQRENPRQYARYEEDLAGKAQDPPRPSGPEDR